MVVSFAPEAQMAQALPQPSPRSQESQDDYLSVAQVARRLGVTVSLVQKWRRLGWLPATRLGPPDVPVYGYHPADVERFVRERWNRRRGRPPKVAGGARAVAGGARPSSQPTARERALAMHPPRPAPAPTAAAPVHVHAPTPVAENRSEPPAATSRTAQPPMPADPPRPALSAPAPAALASSRPLVLWDGDPSHGGAVVLARFPAGQVDEALRVAAVWARRYGSLALGEAPPVGEAPHVLARWEDGVQVSS